MSDNPHLEIERKFLLDRLPEMPRANAIWRIEQGYLNPSPPPQSPTTHSKPPSLSALHTQSRHEIDFGRLRRIAFDDGSVRCFHTIKSGVGMTRLETEREISIDEFERHWPRTAGRRLTKTRHRIATGNLVWEIDAFDELPLALAEVELPSIDAAVKFPDWLKPHVVREVTDDPLYTNASIAGRVGGTSPEHGPARG